MCVGSWIEEIFRPVWQLPLVSVIGKLSLKLQKEEGKPHPGNHDFERSRIVGQSFLKSMLRIW